MGALSALARTSGQVGRRPSDAFCGRGVTAGGRGMQHRHFRDHLPLYDALLPLRTHAAPLAVVRSALPRCARSFLPSSRPPVVADDTPDVLLASSAPLPFVSVRSSRVRENGDTLRPIRA
jgi:hypothetical protein